MSRRRTDVLFWLGVVLGLATFTWIVLTLHSLATQVQIANDARDQLARQVEGLGHTPVAGPPGSRGIPGQSVTGPRGIQGEPGSIGPSGAPGKPGAVGPAGKDSTVPGPPGAQGQGGADSTVPGPQGAAGKDGTDGRDGTDGKAGQPPAGWTYTDPLGVTYTCSRVSNFDESSPEYTCSPSSTPGQQPTPTGPASPAVADRKRS